MTLAELQMELAQVALMYGEDIQVLIRGQDGTVEGGFGAGLRIQLVEMTRVGEEHKPPVPGVLVEGLPGPDAAGPGELDFKWSDAREITHGRGGAAAPGTLPTSTPPGPSSAPPAAPGPTP